MYITFQQTFVYILYTKLKELRQLNFVSKMYKKVCPNVGYVLHTICIHFVYISSDLKKVYIIKLCIQFVNKIHT